MGGSTKQVQNQTSNQAINQSTTQSPWAPSQPWLNQIMGQAGGMLSNTGLTGTETNALNQLSSNAVNNPYQPQFNQLASDLLAGGQDRTGYVTDAYKNLSSSLQPYTTMQTDPYSNSAFQNAVGTMSEDISNRINSQYAGAGYSPVRSGDYAQTLGRGVSQGIAPTWLQAYNDMEGRKLGAINQLYSAGGQTAGLLSGLDQTALANRQAGVGAANTALNQPYQQQLAIEAQRRGIPTSNLASLSSLIVPMAQLGGTSNTTGTQSGTQQTIGQTQVPLSQQIMGGLLGGAGLLGQTGAFGGSGWLTGLFK